MEKIKDTKLPNLLTTKQVAEIIGVSEITISRWREKGMPFKKIGPTGRTIRFNPDDVSNWLLTQGQK